jgi:hypothetical protein
MQSIILTEEHINNYPYFDSEIFSIGDDVIDNFLIPYHRIYLVMKVMNNSINILLEELDPKNINL